MHLDNTICFEETKAEEIRVLEIVFKSLCNMNIDEKYRPNNGYSELLWTPYLAEQWDDLLAKSLSLSETIELLTKARNHE